MPMLFVVLPVQDLPTSRAFYQALGFSINEHSSDGHTAAVVLAEDIVVKLLAQESFEDLVADRVTDPGKATTAVHCLVVADREEVGRLVATALASGGHPGVPVQDDETTLTGSFTDPDGHAWQVSWMDARHVID